MGEQEKIKKLLFLAFLRCGSIIFLIYFIFLIFLNCYDVLILKIKL
jgi:hypothetical protein